MFSVALRVPGGTDPGRGLRATRPLIAAAILDYLRCTDMRYVQIDEILAIARKVPTLHEKAAALRTPVPAITR